MKVHLRNIIHFLFMVFLLAACKSGIKEQKDKIYSRHLQRQLDLKIINTEMPDDKSDMNLLIFTNADDLEKMDVKKITDSLYSKKLLQPLLLVGIGGNKSEEYGLSALASPGNTGSKADKYNEFIMDELYPFIKKRSKVRKFNSIAICGSSLAGLAAFDIAWNNADKIDKVGIFSGNFDYAQQQALNAATNIVLENINVSRKRPKLGYWLYATESNDSSILHNTKELISIINRKNTVSANGIQFVTDKAGNNNYTSWRQNFAGFLVWAFGK